MVHGQGAVAAQREVDHTTNELTQPSPAAGRPGPAWDGRHGGRTAPKLAMPATSSVFLTFSRLVLLVLFSGMNPYIESV